MVKQTVSNASFEIMEASESLKEIATLIETHDDKDCPKIHRAVLLLANDIYHNAELIYKNEKG